jgi:hypothetical protein
LARRTKFKGASDGLNFLTVLAYTAFVTQARDDFALKTKGTLAHRVGMRCSNPNCRQPTSGPRIDPKKSLNVGVAAHITAASKGGPRYDDALSKETRQSLENGIWLCQKCAKLVDNDSQRYPIGLLREWKRLSEEAALLEIESSPPAVNRTRINDGELIRFYAQCFDRPAFQDQFHSEGSMEAFDKAIEGTLTAINTGCLRSRDGALLSQGWGKSFLTNVKWRQHMDVIADLLRAIRARYEDAKKNGVIHTDERSDGMEYYCIHDPSISEWMDSTRSQILQMFSEICKEAAVQAPVFPRFRPRW